jgi:hypothetical protein
MKKNCFVKEKWKKESNLTSGRRKPKGNGIKDGLGEKVSAFMP